MSPISCATRAAGRAPPRAARNWTVLLIGGASGVGKSVAVERVGLLLGLPWLQVDDLRLALGQGGVTIPDADAVETFSAPGGLLTLGELMSPAIEIVIANHVTIAAPIVIEGDGILPALLARPRLRPLVESGQVYAVFLYEADEDALFERMRGRTGRSFEGPGGMGIAAGRAHARKNWLFGRWLKQEAERRGLATLPARPWATLPERILSAVV